MRFGKRRDKEAPEGDGANPSMPPPDLSATAAPDPVVEHEPGPGPVEPEPVAAEAVVEGEAFELPNEPPVAEEPPPEPVPAEPAAPAYQAPVYEPPSSHLVEPEPRVALADSTPHHEPRLNSGSAGGAWPEPAFDLAERPEIVVGAAFGGGLLLALILRRLGH